MDNRWAVLLLSALLGGLPLFPAILANHLPGVGYTDLIPAVWSIWAVAQDFPSLGHTDLLAYPTGMGWYPQSVLTLAFALPIQKITSLTMSYTLSLWIGRSLCFGFAFFAARAWGASKSGAWFAALAFGMSPILTGYAYEGIVEGVHAWPIPLWLWMLSRRSPIGTAASFFLCIIASWYLAAVACLLLVLCFRQDKIAFSLIGLAAAAPFIWLFLSAFPNQSPIPFDIRQAHAITISLPTPFWLASSPPVFGQSAYMSMVLLAVVFWVRRWLALWLIVPVLLGLSLPIISDLPILSSVRFPYRWQLGTLVLALILIKDWMQTDIPKWLPFMVFGELLFCSPFPPLLPTTPLNEPESIHQIDGPVLNIPNWVYRSPGEYNPSKLRAVSIYSAQFIHGQPIMGAPSFNGLSHKKDQIPSGFLSIDPMQDLESNPISSEDIQQLLTIGVKYLLVHKNLQPSSKELENRLNELGIQPIASTNAYLLYKLKDSL